MYVVSLRREERGSRTKAPRLLSARAIDVAQRGLRSQQGPPEQGQMEEGMLAPGLSLPGSPLLVCATALPSGTGAL